MIKKVKPGMLRGNTALNYVTPDPDDYVLNIVGGMSYSLADIVQLVVQSGITTKSAQDLEESFRMVTEKGIEMALSGNNVSFEYIQMRASVTGVFNSPTEPFTRPKHEVNPVVTAGQALLEAAHETRVDNMGPVQTGMISKVIDRKTGEVNTSFTRGGVIEIQGKDIKVGGADNAVLFVMDSETKTIVFSVHPDSLLTNTPTKILVQMDGENLTVGKKYYLRINTQQGNGKTPLKNMRSIISDIDLTCV